MTHNDPFDLQHYSATKLSSFRSLLIPMKPRNDSQNLFAFMVIAVIGLPQIFAYLPSTSDSARSIRFLSTPNSRYHLSQTPSSNTVMDDIQNSRRMNDRIRGARYQPSNSPESTIPPVEVVAAALDVRPCQQNATAAQWKRAWKIGRSVLPVLHRFDSSSLPDSHLSLHCLWWKALAGNDRHSPVYDDGLAYDLLPPFTRRLVGRSLIRFYPRLHHANVELRTAYLDSRIDLIRRGWPTDTKHQIPRDETQGDPALDSTTVSSSPSSSISFNDSYPSIRLISFGSGYDVRSIKLRERGGSRKPLNWISPP